MGRADLLVPRPVEGRAATLDLRPLLARVDGDRRFTGSPVPEAPGGELDDRLRTDAEPALEGAALVEPAYAIRNADRSVGARLGTAVAARFGTHAPPGRVRARFRGSAGQSFGAFLAAGVGLELEGEANDGVGKGMGGGRIVVVPPPGTRGGAAPPRERGAVRRDGRGALLRGPRRRALRRPELGGGRGRRGRRRRTPAST